MTYKELNRLLGNIDLYLLDQILKGRFAAHQTILDAGCGEGRNIKYFVDNGFQVTGCDSDQEAVNYAKLVYRDSIQLVNQAIQEGKFDNSFDAIICINVLHHARSEEEFIEIWEALIKLLNKNGVLFIRTLLTHEEVDFARDEKNHLLISNVKLEALVKEAGLLWIEPLKSENWERFNLGVIVLKKD